MLEGIEAGSIKQGDVLQSSDKEPTTVQESEGDSGVSGAWELGESLEEEASVSAEMLTVDSIRHVWVVVDQGTTLFLRDNPEVVLVFVIAIAQQIADNVSPVIEEWIDRGGYSASVITLEPFAADRAVEHVRRVAGASTETKELLQQCNTFCMRAGNTPGFGEVAIVIGYAV